MNEREGIRRVEEPGKIDQIKQIWQNSTTRQKLVVLTGVGGLAATTCFGALMIGQENSTNSTELQPDGSEDQPDIQPTITITPPTPMPLPTIEEVDQWECKVINNPSWSSYIQGLDIVPNAYRAVLELKDPNIVEPPPYKHIDNGGGEHMHRSLAELDRRKGGKTLFNGEKVCIK